MIEIINIIVILFMAMVVHEYAHAWSAYKLGDPTAKNLGRMSLNPLRHIDFFGTIVLPIVLTVLRVMGISPFFPIALAKPVPVNFFKLRNPKRDMMLVGMAGPAINIVLAVVFSIGLQFDFSQTVMEFLVVTVYINLILAIFNMVPIPPLDGSRLVMGLLPTRLAVPYSRLEPYGILIVFALLPLGLFHRIVLPVVDACAGILGVTIS